MPVSMAPRASMGLFMPFMGGSPARSGAYFTHADGRNSLQLLLQFDASQHRGPCVRVCLFCARDGIRQRAKFLYRRSEHPGWAISQLRRKLSSTMICFREPGVLQESNAKLVSSAASVSEAEGATGDAARAGRLSTGPRPVVVHAEPSETSRPAARSWSRRRQRHRGWAARHQGQGGSPPGQGGGPPPGKGGGKLVARVLFLPF